MVTDRRLLVIYKSEGDLNQFRSLKKLTPENVFGSEVCWIYIVSIWSPGYNKYEKTPTVKYF